MDIYTGKKRYLDRPVANVSADGRYALSINMSRLFNFRPGYGYAEPGDPFYYENHSKNDGVFLIDMETGKSKLVLSLDELWDFCGSFYGMDKKMIINHINFNTDASRFVMLFRDFPQKGTAHKTAVITANRDGSDLYLDEELRTVSCVGTGEHADDYPEDRPMKKDDMMCAQFQMDSGVVVRFMKNGRCRAKIGCHNYRVFGTEGYMERIDRFDKPVIRYNSMKELDVELKEIGGEYMPPEYADNPKASGHGGMDYALLDHFFKALVNGEPAPISLKEGLAMTLPGIYAEESAKRGGELIRMRYPWDKDWKTEID